MQLRNARLCLDCEDVHDQWQCPACASETFAYVSRWVPAPERRHAPRTSASAADVYPERLDAIRRLTTGRVLTSSLVGMTTLGLLSWFWRRKGQPGTGNDRGASPAEADRQ